ncbi:putative serpin-Z6A [Miscanthus floridulus]|uniref:putative serpin-Z6A n=1 Tax=Miscanthus floridulus TaxID=154761 RepID=UPI00345978A8
METAVAAARQYGSSGLTSLSHRLAKQFTAAHGDAARNLVFSPLSIYSALSLVAAGAQGKTLREVLDLLGTGSREDLHMDVRRMVQQAIPASPQDGGPRVSYASGLWHDSRRTPKPAYRDVAAASFRSVVRAVDFLTKAEEARIQINSWVGESTNNLIDSILAPGSVNSTTRLVVTNAIYFKGRWDTPFEKQRTKEDKFHRLDGSSVTAQFMNSSKRQFIGVHDGFKVLRMPYTYRMHRAPGLPRTIPPRYSMCVLLPDTRDGLQGLMDAVASSPSFLQDNLPRNKVKVGEFRVPRFKMSFTKSMREDLQDLGVQAVFSGAAELPDLLEEDGSHEPLFLGDVLHKAVIEVNEEGTEAAAVTACLMLGSCGPGRQPPPPVDFVADHPFAFFVVEEVSGAILFAGHVLDPTQS